MPVVLVAIALSAGAFWFVTSSIAGAVTPSCQVCHKQTQTLMYNCSDLQYFRHLDHGDPMGPCSSTRTARESVASR